MKTVYVGLSGGVDSSVAAALLKDQAYHVVGVYMKNWSQNLPGFICPWREDYHDAKRVAVQLGIDFKMFDFEQQYRQKVVDYMLAEYKIGRTPNPDVMCNQEIKFRLFLDTAIEQGADLVATGHYARTQHGHLFRGLDDNKDQSYFLYRVTHQALERTLFPLGELRKPQVRQLAEHYKLVTAHKKESMGICFVGKVGIKEFLQEFVSTEPGDIVNQAGQKIGRHDGAIFYTIGQRHGLHVGGGLPYYVCGKNMTKNEVYVTTRLDDKNLWYKTIELDNLHWINQLPDKSKSYQAVVRYRAQPISCHLNDNKVFLEEATKVVAAGQSVVIYDEDEILGGGIVI